MATTVVPIPESFSSPRPAATILRFASPMAALKDSPGGRSLSTSTARELATSPASKPPMPSATTKSVSSWPSPSRKESSLFLRTLPGSVMPWCSRKSKVLLRVPEGGGSYPDPVAAPQRGGPDSLAAVDVGAVGGVDVLDVEEATVAGEPGVAPRGVIVVLQDDVARGR